MVRYWLWLATREGIGLRKMHLLLRQFSTPEQVWLADETALRQVEGLGKAPSLEDKKLDGADKILNDCFQKDIQVITMQDAAYPERLRNLDDAPLVLYCRGSMPDFDALPVIAMVGTRKASGYGMMQAKTLGFQIGRMGGLVISGGAYGIDTMALKGALSAGGPVAAVLGCGADIVYPASNTGLFRDICAHGCLLSEYPPGTPALGAHFPVRNRILSGLALGVLVVEAPRRSGALITANHALEQGRDVFTLPANVGSPTCEGNLQLLKDGAILVEEGWDVMREYVHLYPDKIVRRSRPIPMTLTAQEQAQQTRETERAERSVAEKPSAREKDDKKVIDKPQKRHYIDLHGLLDTLSADERAAAECLQEGPAHVDEIIDKTQIAAGRILAALTLLELKGYVTRLPGRRFSLTEHQ